ncbi:type II secretion system protein [Pelomonas sp. V22]|uniref:type IV pilus modification PilV family protein n=1 Tax=Pelomonas sp. V22 TaxID=2822139 RepID=UPI0024A987CD|nr:type II secretion system protein [Pelomonas sp. V22]MDI4635078.1 type II secretion system protein [Pelomonas sp. V22]
MWNERGRRRSRGLANRSTGFTLPEMLMVIVVLGVGLAGVLIAFSTVGRGSADPVLQKQMLSIAEEMMEEIQLRPYVSVANAAPSGCARNTFNDIQDYNGYQTTNKICAIDGTAIPALSSYSVAVGMQPTTVSGVSMMMISVTVRQAGQSLTLFGYRSNYAS